MSKSNSWYVLRRIWLPLFAALAVGAWGCDSDFGMEYAGQDDQGAEQEQADDQAGGYGSEADDVEEIEVTTIAMGRSISPEKEITRPSRVFHPNDTIYVGVTIRGTANDTWLTARWFKGREQIAKTRHRSSPDGLEITEMHIGETPDPLPVGEYRVEVSMNGKVIDVRDFEIVSEEVEIEGT